MVSLAFILAGDTRWKPSPADLDGDSASLHGPHGQGEDTQAGDHGAAAVREGGPHQAALPSPSGRPCDRIHQVERMMIPDVYVNLCSALREAPWHTTWQSSPWEST